MVRHISLIFTALLLSFAQAQLLDRPPAPKQAPSIYESVVRIEVVSLNADYQTPWNSGRFLRSTGTGFLVGKNLFLTNAHVVSNSKRLLITRHGSAIKHPARILFVAHDCDLALLQVENFEPFADLPYLSFGGVPRLDTEVRAIGYPVGGERISVTRGIVSRIDFTTYSHSRIDQHLVVQIDAAINPGNSGGPVLQDGKVVGVAFQGLNSADNTGYMIPTPVVSRFFKDIEDGEYDHYANLGIKPFPLFNPAMRSAFGLSETAPGVLVAEVTRESGADGALLPGDIITALDGNTVDRSGKIIIDNQRIDMNEIVERKFMGDKVELDIIRDGKKLQKIITLKPMPHTGIYAVQYDKKPRYTTQAGLVFQPLTSNLIAAHKLRSPRLRRLYSKYIDENIFATRKDIIVLTRVLNHPINIYLSNYTGNTIESVNGTPVTTLEQLHQLLNPETMPEYLIIQCDGISRPLIIPTKELDAINQNISNKYGLKSLSRLTN